MRKWGGGAGKGLRAEAGKEGPPPPLSANPWVIFPGRGHGGGGSGGGGRRGWWWARFSLVGWLASGCFDFINCCVERR